VSFDKSRVSFDHFRDFSGVVMQQGRVQSDSDWNESQAQSARRIQAGTLDLMGRAAYPPTTPFAFQIQASSSAGGTNKVTIGCGRMYVDGLLAENHGNQATGVWDPALAEISGSPQPPPTTSTNPIDFTAQPYYPGAAVPTDTGTYLAYLDVWKRPITYIEDPYLVDVAIGIDTTGRVQTAWQVKLIPVGVDPATGKPWICSTPDSAFGWNNTSGQLTTGLVTSGPSGPCCLTTGTGYTGVENQLYRVEIHTPGAPGTATFKWSRENASVQTSVTSIGPGFNASGGATTALTVLSLGRDQVLGFAAGNWIEITDKTHDDNCLPGELYKIDHVDVPTSTISLATPLSNSFPTGAITNSDTAWTRIVRWDQSGKILRGDQSLYYDLDAAGGAAGIPVPSDGTSTLILENGITVQFGVSTAAGIFLSMDWWNFAARTADAMLHPALTAAPPQGIYHHRTKLAIVDFSTLHASDCRTQWPPSDAGDCGCCTCTVGDNKESFGKYSSIQDAIQALPARGGEVCILPGRYYENVVLSGLKDIVIHGCGWQTHIYSKVSDPQQAPAAPGGTVPADPKSQSGLEAVFTVAGCKNIALRSFSVHAAPKEAGILLDRAPRTAERSATGADGRSDDHLTLKPGKGDTDIIIEELEVTASTLPAIIAVSVHRLRIAGNRIKMLDVDSRWAAVYLSGTDLFFERNRVGIGAAEKSDSPPGELQPLSAADDLLPQFDLPETGELSDEAAPVRAPGGIQIAGPSKNVFVTGNDIVGGARNGITLGNFVILAPDGTDPGTPTGVSVEPEEDCCTTSTPQIPPATTGTKPRKIVAGGVIENLHIDRNRIRRMQMCGIGPVGFWDLKEALEVISLVNLYITANVISHTLTRPAAVLKKKTASFGNGAICVPDVQNLIIRDNTITDFGATPGAEVCGIFVLHGEIVEISRNQIRETRDWLASPEKAVGDSGGLRAGIVMLLVTPPTLGGAAWSEALSAQQYDTKAEMRRSPAYAPGLPALRIQENVVRVALGLALEAVGFGPFEIVGNHFASGGTARVSSDGPDGGKRDPREPAAQPTSVAGALTVAILNIGLAIEDFPSGQSFSELLSATKLETSRTAGLADSSNGGVLFNNNVCQLEAWGSGARGLASVAIASFDTVVCTGNQLWVDGPSLTAAVDLFVLAATTQITSNRLQEGQLYPVWFSGFTAAGWANITCQNISTYCLKSSGPLLRHLQNLVLFPNELCAGNGRDKAIDNEG
jgi:hypothetical protein